MERENHENRKKKREERAGPFAWRRGLKRVVEEQ